MTLHFDKDILARSNAALFQLLLFGGIGSCIVVALIYDLRRWLM